MWKYGLYYITILHTLDQVCLFIFINLLQQLFTNVIFHLNKKNRYDVYQSAVVLINNYDVIFDQIKVSKHNWFSKFQ